MSDPVIEQLKAFADFRENDVGEPPAEGLHAYAAQAALKELIRNWEQAAALDGTTPGDMLADDLDRVIGALGEIKATLVSGLAERADATPPGPR